MIQSGGLFFPDGEMHFIKYGDDVANYQRPQRDAALKYVTCWRRALDIGAHVGIFSRHFAEHFDEVWAFEPMPMTRECLARNVPANVMIKPYAAGSSAGRRQMFRVIANSGGSFVSDDPDVSKPDMKMAAEKLVSVDVVPIDSFHLEDVGLIKIDAQGSELIALMGAEQTLKRCRPVVLIEEKPIGGAGGEQEGIVKAARFLVGLGMSPKEKVGADRIYIFE